MTRCPNNRSNKRPKLVETEQRRLIRDLVGGELDRIAVVALARLLLCAEASDALVHVGHEFMKMRAALADDRGPFKEEIHQHRLSAPDVAPEIESLGRFGGLPRHQPAKRTRFRRAMEVGKRGLKRREALDDRKLSRIAFDRTRFNERGVAGPDGRHAYSLVPLLARENGRDLNPRRFPTGLKPPMCLRGARQGKVSCRDRPSRALHHRRA
jgi:hypothetical protein